MTIRLLSNDTARCLGAPAGPQGLHVREECQECLRRTAPRYKDVHSFMEPATQFPCEFRIESTEAAAVLPKQLER